MVSGRCPAPNKPSSAHAHPHLTFLPILVLVGRFGLILASYTMQRGAWEHLGCALHWVWMGAMLAVVAGQHGGSGMLVFYMAAVCMQGVLALQLCISHYDKPFIEKGESKAAAGWLRRQVDVSKDVDCPRWVDWFHGGLNLHRVHHLMPRLSRCRYRDVNMQLDQLLDAHGIESDVEPFFSAVSSTMAHLQKQALTVPLETIVETVMGA